MANMINFNKYSLPSDPHEAYAFVGQLLETYRQRVEHVPGHHLDFQEDDQYVTVRMSMDTLYGLALSGDTHAKAHIRYLASKL